MCKYSPCGCFGLTAWPRSTHRWKAEVLAGDLKPEKNGMWHLKNEFVGTNFRTEWPTHWRRRGLFSFSACAGRVMQRHLVSQDQSHTQVGGAIDFAFNQSPHACLLRAYSAYVFCTLTHHRLNWYENRINVHKTYEYLTLNKKHIGHAKYYSSSKVKCMVNTSLFFAFRASFGWFLEPFKCSTIHKPDAATLLYAIDFFFTIAHSHFCVAALTQRKIVCIFVQSVHIAPYSRLDGGSAAQRLHLIVFRLTAMATFIAQRGRAPHACKMSVDGSVARWQRIDRSIGVMECIGLDFYVLQSVVNYFSCRCSMWSIEVSTVDAFRSGRCTGENSHEKSVPCLSSFAAVHEIPLVPAG